MSTVAVAEEQFKYSRLPLTPDGQIINKKNWVLKSPRNQVFLSSIKAGKTDAMIERSKFYVGDAEGGTDSFQGVNFTDLTYYNGKNPVTFSKTMGFFVPTGLYETCIELNRANRMQEFHVINEYFRRERSEKAYKELVSFINSIPFPIFSLDTVTHFMSLVYGSALEEYNNDHNEQRVDIRRVDKFGGAKFIRKKLEDTRNFIEAYAAPFIIYTGHLREKKAVLEKDEDRVTSVDMALEGQLALIFTSKVNSVAVFQRTKEGCFLDYQKRGEDDNDARARHLGGRRIKISELHTYEINEQGEQVLKEKGKTYWERIYPEINFQ